MKNSSLESKNPITMYYEIRIPEVAKEEFISKIDTLIKILKNTEGFLNISLKQMIGESTMVKNYPEALKGVLSNGYINNKKVPLFYSLFIRFKDINCLNMSNIQQWFETEIKPSLKFDYYSGIFTTVAAGNRNAIFTSPDELCNFFKNEPDSIKNNYITVSNHVMIDNKNIDEFNIKTKNLLNIAQNTFRPAFGDLDYNPSFPNGRAGSMENHYYHNAITTEILQNISDEPLCQYLFHGVWESIYDHENSHLDKRFLESLVPMAPYIIIGPVEPFYVTIR